MNSPQRMMEIIYCDTEHSYVYLEAIDKRNRAEEEGMEGRRYNSDWRRVKELPLRTQRCHPKVTIQIRLSISSLNTEFSKMCQAPVPRDSVL